MAAFATTAPFAYPYWDPYYYPFAATVSYPVKTGFLFQNGRVVAFQFLTPSSY